MQTLKSAFISDIHAPWHDTRAVGLCLRILEANRPWDNIILGGDIQDCYAVSRYDKDPQKTKALLSDELKPGKLLLKRFEKLSEAKRMIYLEGNHEDRIRTYLMKYAGALGNSVSVRGVLEIPRDWEYYEYGQLGHLKIGNFIITHGTLCSKYAASHMLSKYGCNVLFGHTHKFQTFSQRVMDGRLLEAVSSGWMGHTLKAQEYVKNVADSHHGFVVLYQCGTESWYELVKIKIKAHKYRAIFQGKLYEI